VDQAATAAQAAARAGPVVAASTASVLARESCSSGLLPRPSAHRSIPTMTRSAERVRGTLNVALACAAAFQAIHRQNAREPGSIRSVPCRGWARRPAACRPGAAPA